jgi:CheY-like chemotaxis protein
MGPSDNSRGVIEEIRKAGEQAISVTRQLLAFSRKQVLRLTPLNLNSVVTGTQKMLGRLIGEDIELSARLDPAAGMVMADPGQMGQVVLNLAVNARDAMPQGGRLIVETANADLDDAYARASADVPPGRYVLLAVTDTGCGMDAATRAKIFEPFFTTKEVGKGSGLGLATVYGIIKQSGGHIAVFSEPGFGTTFKIYLPRVETRPSPRAPIEDPQPRGGHEVILLVEDEASLRRVASRVLRLHGYTVLEAGSGGEALEVFESQSGRIDLLLTDMIMPRMSGRQLADWLRGLRSDLKVLLVSGYTNDEIWSGGVLDDLTAFLPKPFDPDSLARAVRELLDKERSPALELGRPT